VARLPEGPRRLSTGLRISILVAATLSVSHAVALLLYLAAGAGDLSRAREQHVADQLVTLTRLLEALPTSERIDTAHKLSDYSLQISIDDHPRLVRNDAWSADAVEMRELLGFAIGAEMNQSVLADYRQVTGNDLGAVELEDLPDREIFASRIRELFRFREDLLVSIRLENGDWLNVLAPSTSLAGAVDPALVLGVALIALLATLLLSWRVAKPFRSLSRTAEHVERLGPQPGRSPLAEEGPFELRRLLQAFNALQNRLQTLLDERSLMISAATRDLPAPLGRMRLRAQDVANERLRQQMLGDIDDMEAMVQALADRAGQHLAEQPRFRVDLARMLEELAEEFQLPPPVLRLRGVPEFTFECVPVALRQAFAHVVSNAVTYGRTALISLELLPDSVLVLVDDEGPGLAETEREKVFLPFYRLEPAQARNPGGIGLGLSAAREIIRAHGGDIELLPRSEGQGTCARVSLPLTGAHSHEMLQHRR